MEATFGIIEIKTLLQKIQVYNKRVGQFKSFTLSPNFDYVVQLTNGKITIKFSEMQADQTNSLTPLQITSIGTRFQADAVGTSTVKKTSSTSQEKGFLNTLKRLFS